MLLNHGAPAGLADAAGDTPAHLAARAGHLEVLAEVMQVRRAGGKRRRCTTLCPRYWVEES